MEAKKLVQSFSRKPELNTQLEIIKFESCCTIKHLHIYFCRLLLTGNTTVCPIHLSQDTKHWRDIVIEVTNFQVPQKGRGFLGQLRDCSPEDEQALSNCFTGFLSEPQIQIRNCRNYAKISSSFTGLCLQGRLQLYRQLKRGLDLCRAMTKDGYRSLLVTHFRQFAVIKCVTNTVQKWFSLEEPVILPDFHFLLHNFNSFYSNISAGEQAVLSFPIGKAFLFLKEIPIPLFVFNLQCLLLRFSALS